MLDSVKGKEWKIKVRHSKSSCRRLPLETSLQHAALFIRKKKWRHTRMYSLLFFSLLKPNQIWSVPKKNKRQTLLTSHFHVGQALTPGQPPSLKVSRLRSSHSIFWKDTKYSFVGLLSYKHFPVAALSSHHPWAQVESWSSEPRASILRCRLPIRLHDLHSHTWHLSPSAETTLIPFKGGRKRKGAVENWLQ